VQVDVELSFKEMAFGIEKELRLFKQERCVTCSGDGAEPGSSIQTCKTCQGSGQVRQMQRTIFGSIQTAAVCSACQGRGKVPEKTCHTCRGAGVERREKSLRVPIPAGLNEGDALKVPGEGEAAPHGGRPGDLYVRIHVKADPRFTREENDVLSEQFVPFSTLALGGSIQVETLDGPLALSVDAHTPVGTVLTIKGKGISSSRGHRGHHQVRLVADIPKKITKEQREVIEKLKHLGL
jgi:molecular chaperone DnaJ